MRIQLNSSRWPLKVLIVVLLTFSVGCVKKYYDNDGRSNGNRGHGHWDRHDHDRHDHDNRWNGNRWDGRDRRDYDGRKH